MLHIKDLLHTEQKFTPATAAISVACTVSGLICYIYTGHSVWLQWLVLLHLLTGIACSIIFLPYLALHSKRTVGFRRISVLLSGMLSVPVCISFIYTGWHLLLFGQLESTHWIYTTHIVSAGLFVVIVLLHLFLHTKLLPQKRQSRSEAVFPSFPANSHNFLLGFNILLLVAVLAATVFYQANLQAYTKQPIVNNYEYSYGPHRFRPSQTETSNKAFIDRRQIANSHRCASCHEDISKQWFSSVHQQAAADPTYVSNISLLEKKKGISATRYCEGCHAPVALLTGELSPGGEHGGISGTPANNEGISCMSCHGIDSLSHLKGVASFVFKPADDYLFAQSSNHFLMRIHDLLIRVRPSQHKKDLGKPLFQEAKFCSACHTQFMDKDMNNWGWIKMQDEYTAWLESPYSHHHSENFSNVSISRCQDCHMPLVNSSDPSANIDGKVRAHHFPGANTFLPLLRADQQQLEETKTFMQSNKLRVSIDKPHRKDAQQTLQALNENLRNTEESPFYYYLGEQANIEIIISNHGVGHDFPGGTIDINQAWVECIIVDAEGQTIYSSGLIDKNNYVDTNAHFYRSVAVDRQGNSVWKHDLFNMVGESFRRVIKAGESDIVRYSFTVPSWAKSPIIVSATLKYRKLNERYAKWALKDKYIKIPVVNLAWDTLKIPLRIRKEVE